MRFLSYARSEGGTGRAFFERKPAASSFLGVLIPLSISLLMGFRGLLLAAGFALLVSGILLYYQKRIGGITGDMLGALIETTEAALFLIASTGGIL